MIITAFITISSISRGSKNVFAKILICYILLLSIAYVENALDGAFKRQVELPDASLDIVSNTYSTSCLACNK